MSISVEKDLKSDKHLRFGRSVAIDQKTFNVLQVQFKHTKDFKYCTELFGLHANCQQLHASNVGVHPPAFCLFLLCIALYTWMLLVRPLMVLPLSMLWIGSGGSIITFYQWLNKISEKIQKFIIYYDLLTDNIYFQRSTKMSR